MKSILLNMRLKFLTSCDNKYMMRPVYLYIKRHSVTGKCYFGKTTRDPKTYLGSGLHWVRHIKQHGKDHVETLWFKMFTDQEECTRVAILFSEQQRIVESDLWLNMKVENGLDGCVKGTKFSSETCKKMSEWKRSDEMRNKISEIQKARFSSKDARKKLSLNRKGKLASPEAKLKMSEAAKHRTLSDEGREALKSRVISPETKAKISEAAKKRHQLRKEIEHAKNS